MLEVKSGRVKVKGLNDNDGIKEFIHACNIWVYNREDKRLSVREFIFGTSYAFSYILQHSLNMELKNTLINIFNKYDATFEASWDDDNKKIQGNYFASINLLHIPSPVCKKIISLSNKLEKTIEEDVRKKIKKKISEENKLKKQETKKDLNKLRKF